MSHVPCLSSCAWEFAMSPALSDRNLLFGILALQNNFISREQLLAGFNAWVAAKDRALGEFLREQQALTPERHALLEALVQEHLKQHDNDAEKSLAAVGWQRSEIRGQGSKSWRVSSIAFDLCLLTSDLCLLTSDL
jgi:hypothetical protein